MENKPRRIPRDRMDEIANRLIQIILSILPIVAGIIGVLFQQQKKLEFIGIVIALGLASLMFVLSALLNIQVQRFPETYSDDDDLKLYRLYRNGVTFFTVGVILVMISPIGFATNALNPALPSAKISLAQKEIDFTDPVPGSKLHDSAAIAIDKSEQVQLNIQISSSDESCLKPSLNSLDLNLSANRSKLITWENVVGNACSTGNYIILIESFVNGNKVGDEIQVFTIGSK